MNFGEPIKFSFNSTGEFTGQIWLGEFEVKPILSPRDRAFADSERRRFMGSPEFENNVDQTVQNAAFMIGQLKARLIKYPSWVKETDFLAEMIDTNILTELFDKVFQIQKDYQETLNKKANEAKDLLKNEQK